jgi:hypothetical protein
VCPRFGTAFVKLCSGILLPNLVAVFVEGDSVTLRRFAVEAIRAAESRPRTVFLFIPKSYSGTSRALSAPPAKSPHDRHQRGPEMSHRCHAMKNYFDLDHDIVLTTDTMFEARLGRDFFLGRSPHVKCDDFAIPLSKSCLHCAYEF